MILTDDHLREGMEQLKGERHALALEQFTLAADGAASPEERAAAEAFAAQIALTVGRPYEAIAWAERLRDSSATPDEADLLEASAWVALGDGPQALALLGSIGPIQSPYSDYPDALVHQLRCQAHGLADHPDEALVAALTALLVDWALPEIWRALAVLAAGHEVDVTEAVGRIPEEGVLQVLGWLIESPASGVDCIVEAIWNRWPGDRQVLALVTSLGNRLPLERAMEWSGRLRAAGLADSCAVLGIAATDSRPAPERARAAAVAGAAFADARAVPLMELAASQLPDEDVIPTFRDVLELGTGDVVDAFVVAAATTSHRSLAIAGALLELGVANHAVALARHAVELGTGQPALFEDAVATSLTPETASRLATELADRGAPELAALYRTGIA